MKHMVATGLFVRLSAPSQQRLDESVFFHFFTIQVWYLSYFSSLYKVTVKLEFKYFFILTQMYSKLNDIFYYSCVLNQV